MADLHPVPPAAAAGTLSPLPDLDAYRTVSFQLIDDPEGFWLGIAGRLVWDESPKTAQNADGHWFADGLINTNESCLDRHIYNDGQRPAFIWRGGGKTVALTIQELFEKVGTFASGLKMLGVTRGARVALVMGNIPEMIIATLACARIGATRMPLASYTRANVLREHIDAFKPMAIITQDESRFGGRTIPTKGIVDAALKAEGHSVQFIIVAPHTGGSVKWKMGVDIWWEHSIVGASAFCPPTILPGTQHQLVLPTEDGPKSFALGGLLSYSAWSQSVVLDTRPGRLVAVLSELHTLQGQALGIFATLANGCTIALSESMSAASLPAGIDGVLGDDLDGLTQTPRVLAGNTAISAENWAILRATHPTSAIVGTLSSSAGIPCMATFPPAVPGGPGLLGLALPGSRALLQDEDGEIIRGPASGRLILNLKRPGLPWHEAGRPPEHQHNALHCRPYHQGLIDVLKRAGSDRDCSASWRIEDPMRFKLRPYQQDAIHAVVEARRRGVRRMVIALPTGSGKTVIFSRLAAMASRKVLVLAHRAELLQQAKDKLERTLDGKGVVDIEQACARSRQEAQIVVASLRSLHEARLTELREKHDFGLIIYDECHHAPAEDNQRILRSLGVFDHDFTGTLLGFTATTMRGDGKGLDKVFEEIVFSRTLPEMIQGGYLVKLRGYKVATHADLQHIGGSGDFNQEELEEAVNIEDRNALVARSIQELARDRRTIAFCVTVAHARNLARALALLGVPAGIIHGEMKKDDRV